MSGLQDARRGILQTQINRCTSNVNPSPRFRGDDNLLLSGRRGPHSYVVPARTQGPITTDVRWSESRRTSVSNTRGRSVLGPRFPRDDVERLPVSQSVAASNRTDSTPTL